jgi:hypothetical protein
MKTRNMNKRFALHKQTVANLSISEQELVRAGADDRCTLVQCKSTSAYYYSSSAYVINTVVIPSAQMDTRNLPCYMEPTTDTR